MNTQARFLAFSCLAFVACDVETPPSAGSTETTGDEDGESESDGDGDGEPGDGDGEPGDGDGDGDGDPSICLNGIVEPGEECDEGMETWFCDPDCTYATCGDGYYNPLAEPCDDGNTDDTDACVGECSINVCGDGMRWEAYEQCDDGNFDSTDECVSGCQTASCGDGYVHEGVEECDDGNDIDDDACKNDCTIFVWWASGPQTNVPTEQLLGWTQCWSGTYDQEANLDVVFNQQCTGSKLLEACRPVGADAFTVLAMGERADVLFDTTDGVNAKHEANGVAWYYGGTPGISMGFARAGDTVVRKTCDISDVNAEERMCWHEGHHDNAYWIAAGWRCGATQYLNDSTQWERLIYQAD